MDATRSGKAREYAVKRLYLVTSPGAKNAIIHRINPDLPESVRQRATSAPLVRRNTESECASAPIDGAHTQHTHSDAVSDPADDSQEAEPAEPKSPPVDLTDNSHAPPPNPVLADGAVQLDLVSGLGSDAGKGSRSSRPHQQAAEGRCLCRLW
jgi:hypothetical protein